MQNRSQGGSTAAASCALASLLLLLLFPPLASCWEYECVDDARQLDGVTDRSLQIDTGGRPHVTYGGDRLYYTWHDGSEWHLDIADSAACGCVSMVLDEDGHPCVSYGRVHAGSSGWDGLVYTRLVGTAWISEVVDPDAELHGETSLALDADGFPHIAYVAFNANLHARLRYAHRDVDGWHVEVIDQEAMDTGLSAILVLDSTRSPHIFHYTYEPFYDLIYAHKTTQGWDVTAIATEGDAGRFSSAAISSSGVIHIVYSSWGGASAGLQHAWQSADGWHTECVDTEATSGGVSLVVGPTGMLHATYTKYAYGGACLITYARNDGTQWHEEIVAPFFDPYGQTQPALALDPDEQPRVCYLEKLNVYGSGRVTYAAKCDVGWVIETIDRSALVGPYPWLVLDAQGHANVSYWDSSNQDLRCAWRDAAGWHHEVIDSVGHVGEFTAIALDSGDFRHLTYCRRSSDELIYAHEDEAGWHFEVVANVGDNLRSSSLALDSFDRPHLVYRSDSLWYALRDASGWNLGVLPSVGVAPGSFAALALDSSDHAHVCYACGPDLVYAVEGSSGWDVEIVDSPGTRYDHVALALDSMSNPHVAYKDDYNSPPNADVWYGFKDDAGWHFEMPQTSPTFGPGEWVCLALDAADTPHLLYTVEWAYSLYYAHKTSGVWILEPLGSVSYGGRTHSLTLDRVGGVHVAYSHKGKLWYVRSGALRVPGILNPDLTPQPIVLRIAPQPARGHMLIQADLHLPASRPEIAILDILGRRVRRLCFDATPDGRITMSWDGLDDRGLRVPSGTYICSAEAGGARASTRVVVLR